MSQEIAKPQSLSFRGEVVEIFEKQGQSLARIMIETREMLDVATPDLGEAHLGDKVVISARVSVEDIKPV